MNSSETLLTIFIVIGGIVLAAVLSAIAVIIMRSLRAGTLRKTARDYVRALGYAAIPVLLLLSLPVLVAVMGPLGIIAWIILLFVMIEGWRKYRATRQHGLLWLLTVSAERSMPLAPAIEAFARERGGWFSRLARRLVELLGAGVPLPDALDRCPGLLPRYATPTIRVGYETGTLARALRRVASVRDLDGPVWMALQGKIAYLLLLPAFGTLLLTFVMIKIVPAFEKIFRDFESTLPQLTLALIKAGNFAGQYSFLLWPVFLLGPALLFYLPIRYFGWTHWDLPGMGRLVRRLDSAEILDTLALVAGQQRPLLQGIAALAHSYPKRQIRWRLGLVVTDVTLGGDWCESLLGHGLIRQPEFAILQAAQRVGNLPWALKEMADSVRRRLGYRIQAVVQMLFPPVVVLMGLVVMFIVVALFLPVIALIMKLA
jgi:type II secretory pathway component PulF